MAEKPKVKAPKQRTTTSRDPARGRRLAVVAASAGLVLGFLAVAVLLGFVGGGGVDEAEGRATIKAAGCTLKDFKATSRRHLGDPAARPKQWTSFPPTSGPHYVTPAVYGYYQDPVELARVLHGLEHGGAYILYGPKSPPDTADRLRAIYDRDPRGLVVAPLPGLGNKIALGAWTSPAPGSEANGIGHLALCTTVDEDAVLAFLSTFRGRGPESADLDLLQPGGT
jgi:hypothetical protein